MPWQRDIFDGMSTHTGAPGTECPPPGSDDDDGLHLRMFKTNVNATSSYANYVSSVIIVYLLSVLKYNLICLLRTWSLNVTAFE